MAMGLHQQSTGFSLGHLHSGFSAAHESLRLTAKRVMSLVTMVPTAEVSVCPLRSNMHPSRMTIILIQLVLLKRITHEGPVSILIYQRKVSLSQQGNEQNMRLYNRTLTPSLVVLHT